jgi:hypothetical protein
MLAVSDFFGKSAGLPISDWRLPIFIDDWPLAMGTSQMSLPRLEEPKRSSGPINASLFKWQSKVDNPHSAQPFGLKI